MIILENIEKSYRIAGKKRLILDRINLEVKKGEMVAVTGKSGSGKSTLLNIISGLTRPDRGSFHFSGKRVRYFLDIMPSRLRNRKIGFIFQTFRLLSDETLISNILMPARIKGWIGKKTNDYSKRILKDLGLIEFMHMKAGFLSGGQKQRAAIARALINDPDLILADEPTANLDQETSLEICRILEGLAQSGKTVIAVTHQDYLTEHADKILRLEDGRLTGVN